MVIIFYVLYFCLVLISRFIFYILNFQRFHLLLIDLAVYILLLKKERKSRIENDTFQPAIRDQGMFMRLKLSNLLQQ